MTFTRIKFRHSLVGKDTRIKSEVSKKVNFKNQYFSLQTCSRKFYGMKGTKQLKK